jgi:hypothetical protein
MERRLLLFESVHSRDQTWNHNWFATSIGQYRLVCTDVAVEVAIRTLQYMPIQEA